MTITRIRFLVALFPAVLLVAGCDDPFEDNAQRPNIDVGLETWAMTGSPASFPTALFVPLSRVDRPDAAGSFDLAFDIDADGRLMVIPVSRVVTALGGNRTIGLMRGEGPYNLILEAPRTGWTFDSVLTVNPGGTFLVKVQTLFCQFDFRQDIHARFFVDSVIPEERRAKLSMRLNPNCGYRSLVSGIPEY